MRHLDGKSSIAVYLIVAAPVIARGSEIDGCPAIQKSSTLAASVNFTVYSYAGGPIASEFADSCEELRLEIGQRWLTDLMPEHWQPRCTVVLHATRRSYIVAVGHNAGPTSGSSLIERQGGRIIRRRVDLLIDQNGKAAALPHELTHVVLADAFVGQYLPPWLDEGIATLADSEDKLTRHQRDCDDALRNGTAFNLMDLVTLDRLPSPAQFPAFYGQSVSLVTFLSHRDNPQKLLPFAKLAALEGYDAALRKCYRIDGVGDLERLWLEYVATAPRGQTVFLTATRLNH